MNKIKYNIFYLIGLLVLMASIITVFAAFVFSQTVVVTTKLGNVELVDKKYTIYERGISTTPTDPNYLNPGDSDYAEKAKKAAKMRTDAVTVIDEIELNFTATYTLAAHDNHQIFVEGTNYYTKSGNEYTLAEVEYGTEIPATPEYYTETGRTYSGIKSAKGYDTSISAVNWTVSGGNVITATVNSLNISLNCTISNDGKITATTITVKDGQNNTLNHYKAVIGSTGLYIVIIDTDLQDTSATEIDADSNLTCSATSDKYMAGVTGDKYYLSQVGIKFSFKSAIDVYVRIRIRDSWIRIKDYHSSVRGNEIVKDDSLSGSTPFAITDSDWYYDRVNNYVYLKEKYHPDYVLSTGAYDSTKLYYTRTGAGTVASPYEYSLATVTSSTYSANTYYELETKTYSFCVNEAYFYNITTLSSYTEYIDVKFGYAVEIVQANRIFAKWGKNPSVDFS
ncbi:MAG: hypothetical protein K6E20_01885 [Acholeplasmatales bacterium]|nr:hypothetical protein [Acholeplasmatales bacterium]